MGEAKRRRERDEAEGRQPRKYQSKRGDLMLLGRMVAAVDILGRTGMTEINIQYDDDRGDDANVPVTWWVEGRWGNERVFSEHFPYPAQAVEDLLGRVLNGGYCKRCGNRSVVGIVATGDYCCFTVIAEDLDDTNTYRYVRTCETAAALEALGPDQIAALHGVIAPEPEATT